MTRSDRIEHLEARLRAEAGRARPEPPVRLRPAVVAAIRSASADEVIVSEPRPVLPFLTVRARRVLVAAAAAQARIADARIGEGPWLDGETFTWADVMMGHALYRWYEMPIERPTDTPNLDAYYKRLCARPAFAEHVMVPFESLKARD